MRRWVSSSMTMCLLALFPAGALADDICGGDKERQRATAEAQASLAKAQRSGKPAEQFVVYRALTRDDCVSDDLRNQALAQLPKLGRDLAKQAEAAGFLYTIEPVRAEGKVSAFAWYEAIRDFPAADRVMLKAVRGKPDDLGLFKAAWDVDELSGQRGMGEVPYKAPAAYRRDLEKVARASAGKLMAQEEKDAQGLVGSLATVGLSAGKSMEKLRLAAEWMRFLPEGDQSARARAEQRGDTIMKRGDSGLMGGLAVPYYEFAGSPKAAQVQQRQEQHRQAMEESAEKVQGAITEKGEADQKKFQKGKADLEKELGF